MAFLNDLRKAKLKPTKTKITNIDSTISKESPYKQQIVTIHECPDVHFPRKQYVAMDKVKENEDQKQKEQQQGQDDLVGRVHRSESVISAIRI